MLDLPTHASTPRERRHAETAAEILAAAWDLARRDGLAGISLRELARRVGLRAPSLYTYFDSKAALYDAMFRQGHEELAGMVAGWPELAEETSDVRAAVERRSAEFAAWCAAEPARYQLLFQRTVPDFEPSPGSYALAVRLLEHLERDLAALGITDRDAVDLWTALISGLVSQQVANDPGGDRWLRLVGTAVDMFLDHYTREDPA